MAKGFKTPCQSSPEAPSVMPQRSSARINGGVIGPKGNSELPQLFMDEATPAPATEPVNQREALTYPIGIEPPLYIGTSALQIHSRLVIPKRRP
jgi:hypothetical protein